MDPKLYGLIKEGYCLFEDVLSDDLLRRLRVASDKLLDENETEHKDTNQGNLAFMQFQDPAFLDLITWPGALAVLSRLGFDRPRFWSGFAIAKERGETPLYWHQDWVFWDEPEAADRMPHQLFFMYYLTDTQVENGCLRLIPKSHRQRFDLHEHLGKGHDSDIRHTDDHRHPLFSKHSAEIDVSINAGDLVVGDARLLHSAHTNQTGERRTVLTLWYLPCYDETSERVRAGYRERTNTAALQELCAEDRQRIAPLVADYKGDVEPAVWNRVPGALLR